MRFKLGFITLGLAGMLAAGSVGGVALGSSGHRVGLGPIQSAADKTSKAGSSKFTFSVTIKGKGLPAAGATITGDGAVDTKHQTGKFRINLGSLASLAGSNSGQIPSTIDAVLVKGVFYVRIPSLAQQLGKGKEWLKLDVKTLPKSTTGGIDPSALKADPASLAKLASSVSVHKVGSAKIRGSSTTKYRATIDVAKIVSTLPKSQQAAAKKSFAQLGLSKIPVDVYIDGSSYIRRVALALGFSAGTSGRVSFSVVTDLFDFGSKVSASAPPAAKTADAGPLISQLLGGVTGK
jgi:hypothetical protein